MIILIFLFFVIVSLYLAQMTWFLAGWKKLKPITESQSDKTVKLPVISVVIAFRNEKKNIGSLLHSLGLQNYPRDKFEVILVDDHSDDNTVKLIKNSSAYDKLNVIIESNSAGEKGKKAALKKGVRIAKGELIVQTDADCQFQASWISSIAHYYSRFRPSLILAPVQLVSEKPGFLQHFQRYENNALMIVTGGSAYRGVPLLSNGANMAYSKKLIDRLEDPFLSAVPSGDDLFLLQNIQSHKETEIHFLKSPYAVVTTAPGENFNDFWNQRKRWIQKSRYYKDRFLIINSLIIFLVNLFVFPALAYSAITESWWVFATYFGLKIIMDTLLIFEGNRYSGKPVSGISLLFSHLLYPLYSLCLTFFAGTGKIMWKNRNVREK